jgi:hypothetical protein
MSTKHKRKAAASTAKPLTIANAEAAGRKAYEEAVTTNTAPQEAPQPKAPAPAPKQKPDLYDAKMAAVYAMEEAARQTEINELNELFTEFKRIAFNADLSLMVRLLRMYQANQPFYGYDPLLPVAFMEEIFSRADTSSLVPLRPALRANLPGGKEPGIGELQQQLTAFILIGLSGASLSRLQEVARVVDMQLTGMLSRPAENFIRDAIRAHYMYGGLTLEWVRHQIDQENPDGFGASFQEAVEHRQRWDEMYSADGGTTEAMQ